jgi:hypothetical protein
MICVLTVAGGEHALEGFSNSEFARRRSVRLRVLSYRRAMGLRRVSAGTFIFADLERLGPAEQRYATALRRALLDANAPILNDPVSTMRRFELLRTLYVEGLNPFNVYRASERGVPGRFPVFVHAAHDHVGPLTPLLQAPAELEQALARLHAWGHQADDLLVCEFQDTASDRGLFRKYGAHIIGDKIIPEHVFFGSDWMVKEASAITEPDLWMREEEERYLKENPHRDQVRAVARVARIDYGRIDYSMHEGSVVVWEFNTNPLIENPDRRKEILPSTPLFYSTIAEAFTTLPQSEVRRSLPNPRATSPVREALWSLTSPRLSGFAALSRHARRKISYRPRVLKRLGGRSENRPPPVRTEPLR